MHVADSAGFMILIASACFMILIASSLLYVPGCSNMCTFTRLLFACGPAACDWRVAQEQAAGGGGQGGTAAATDVPCASWSLCYSYHYAPLMQVRVDIDIDISPWLSLLVYVC